ncbi:BTAD domain-containing putative transcriptional regulator [Virgisporangium aliadipatigenens]|uniref:BTAD domain-containing putative transcriptional regulator n=1 Tax=Virgisporangium aliadipatigenens TaxID=741659 RepID=UPI0019424929|nr:BTAD domain-containing putative transcriptional regulator [Virgisporangium aliadipatigenens]
MSTTDDRRLRIRLLGPLRVTRAGANPALGPARQQAVLAALAAWPDRAMPRAELIAAVWGDEPPPSAAGNLYTYISTLRRSLTPDGAPGPVLSSENGTYRLRAAAVDVDAWCFETFREEGLRLRADRDADGERAALTRALELWHGPEALDGVPGPDAANRREHLRELYLATVERHAQLTLDRGRAEELVEPLGRLVAAYPARESLHDLAMHALVRVGRRDEAVLLYRRLRNHLAAHTGALPAAPLRDLHAGLVAGHGRDPALPPRHPGFVGHTAETALLERALDDVAHGRGASIWIDGPSGSGKSALLAEGLRGATAHGCRVGWAVGDELARRVPYGLIIECLDDGNGGPDGPGPLRVAARDPNAAMTVVDEVRALVDARCAAAPLVLVADDLQWADDASLVVWHALHRLTATLPLLLVAASRPLPTSRELRLLRQALMRGGTRFVDVPPLSDEVAGRLVRHVAPAADARTVAEVVDSAAGNAQLLRHLATPGGDDALTAAVLRHLHPLRDETRHLLRVAAFLGADCPVAELPVVTGTPVPALVPAAEEALAAGLLVEDGGRLRFRYPVMRRVLYRSTPTALRVMMHRDFAQRIAESGGSAVRVAGHLAAGPVSVDAWIERWLLRHGEALSAAAPDLAEAVFRQALASPLLSARARDRIGTLAAGLRPAPRVTAACAGADT